MSAAAAVVSTATSSTASGSSSGSVSARTNPPICRFFVRGNCRFGAMCRFSHDLSGGEASSSSSNAGESSSSGGVDLQPKPSTSRSSWANAPIFVPHGLNRTAESLDTAATGFDVLEGASLGATNAKSYADVAGTGVPRVGVITVSEASSMHMICPFEGGCPYGKYCLGIHLELCKMCDQYCLHPADQAQRRKHNQECLQQHEQAMELSFAIARSKDKTCGICFDTILEKAGREKRFGILPNCNHIFCLECIRKWRQAKQFEHKITRSCPECRISSDFVCPSAFWVETKEEKDKLLNDYRKALGDKDCKYFKKGEGKCPFGNKCFYKHALPNGELIDVGCPKRARKLHRGGNEIMDLLDIYLWEFVDQRDYHWLEVLSTTSDDSGSEWEDD